MIRVFLCFFLLTANNFAPPIFARTNMAKGNNIIIPICGGGAMILEFEPVQNNNASGRKGVEDEKQPDSPRPMKKCDMACHMGQDRRKKVKI